MIKAKSKFKIKKTNKTTKEDTLKKARPPSVKEALHLDVEKETAEGLQEVHSKKSLWGKFGTYVVGFVSFLIGIILFFPLDDFALEMLNKVDLGGRLS